MADVLLFTGLAFSSSIFNLWGTLTMLAKLSELGNGLSVTWILILPHTYDDTVVSPYLPLPCIVLMAAPCSSSPPHLKVAFLPQ